MAKNSKGKRMVSEDLIKKLESLDPSAGATYTAGTGIDISAENEISVDTDTVALKSELPDAVSGTNDGTNWTSITIGEDTYDIPAGAGATYTAGDGIDIDANNKISANIKAGSGIVVDVDLTDDSVVVMVDQDDIPYKTDLATVATSGSYNDLSNKPTIPTVTNSITQGSTDAVTSGAVYAAIGDIESLLAAI